MSDELISKQKLLSDLRNWEGGDVQTLYGQGYEDAVRDVIKLIETEVPVNAVELPCKAGTAIYVLQKSGKIINETKVLDLRVLEDDVHLYVCGYGYYSSDYIGKVLFFSQEEAEAALKERCVENDKE